jgi:membrane protein implicated in regulation of membrane protease activity
LKVKANHSKTATDQPDSFTAKIRLIFAIVTSLLDEALILAFILWLLPEIGVKLPWWGLALCITGFAAFAVTTYVLGSRVINKLPMPGFTSYVGLQGKVMERLNPQGLVKIEGELWSARSEEGLVEAGSRVIVTGQKGLKLMVRRVR